MKYLWMVFSLLVSIGHVQDASASGETKGTTLIVLADATGSLDDVFLGQQSLRELLQGTTRDLVRATTDHRTSVDLVLIRVCGFAELVYRGSVTKRDYAQLSLVMNEGLAACNIKADSPDAKAHQNRASGTDLSDGFRMLASYLELYVQHEIIFVMLSDGFNQPPELAGAVDNEGAISAMEAALTPSLEDVSLAVALGLHSETYAQWDLAFSKLFAGNSRAYGLNDMQQGRKDVVDLIITLKR